MANVLESRALGGATPYSVRSTGLLLDYPKGREKFCVRRYGVQQANHDRESDAVGTRNSDPTHRAFNPWEVLRVSAWSIRM